MAGGDGNNRFSDSPGNSRWIVESGPGDTCLNTMAVLRVVGDTILSIPKGPSPLDEEQAEGLFRMLMSARDAVGVLHSHLDRLQMEAGNG